MQQVVTVTAQGNDVLLPVDIVGKVAVLANRNQVVRLCIGRSVHIDLRRNNQVLWNCSTNTWLIITIIFIINIKQCSIASRDVESPYSTISIGFGILSFIITLLLI